MGSTDLLQNLHAGVVKAPAGAIIALVLIVGTTVLLTIGWRLAVRRRFVAHGWVQTTAVALNAAVALTWMVRSLIRNVLPEIPARLAETSYAVALVHAALGMIATVLGVYVVLVGTKLLPRRLSFTRYRPVMRSSYALYLAGALSGVILYVIAYIGL